MRAAALALAALCLLAGSARADMDHNDAAWLATCGNSSGMPGGWSPISADSTIPQELLAALDDEFSARFADNLTTWSASLLLSPSTAAFLAPLWIRPCHMHVPSSSLPAPGGMAACSLALLALASPQLPCPASLQAGRQHLELLARPA